MGTGLIPFYALFELFVPRVLPCRLCRWQRLNRLKIARGRRRLTLSIFLGRQLQSYFVLRASRKLRFSGHARGSPPAVASH